MKFSTRFEGSDKYLLLLLTFVFALVALVLHFTSGGNALLVLLVLAVPTVLAAQIGLYRGTLWRFDVLSREMNLIRSGIEGQYREYRRIESLFSLFGVLKVTSPLPSMRDWAISPDFGNLIVDTVHERRPKLALEFGSGVSTLVAGYALREAGGGMLISLEHDRDFAEATIRNLKKHGLGDLVRVVHAPLRQVQMRGRDHLWYDTAALEDMKEIEFVIVDGPPGDLQELARYPALPLIWSHLRDDAVILIDDANRADERKMAELWCSEFPSLEAERIPTEAGAVIFLRSRG
ncbi:MAG TPA: class I SAM-dependent methyltransferase [Patescibacteria group bacterium]|nr:class I SAM-dependent methyltransferase [Patescibacteria group bacterium]